jgi:hypothetical protein
VHTWFWRGNLGVSNHLEELDIDGRIILKMSLQQNRVGEHGLN